MRGKNKSGQRLIAYRRSLDDEEETALKKHFTPADLNEVKEGDRVLLRFSALPFPELLQKEIESRGGKTIQSESKRSYLADFFCWYPDLKELTPRSWASLDEADKANYQGPFFVKGETNARKHQFNQLCFAKDTEALAQVMERLKKDPLIGSQKLVIREFVPLKTYFKSESGLPIAEEYRFFCYKDRVLAKGAYWSQYQINTDPERVPREFIDAATSRVKADFYSLDVAQTEEGQWIVIEVGDGAHSGLCGCDPKELYQNLALELRSEK
jgi:hypothetical protein